jgi:hypothetical protein
MSTIDVRLKSAWIKNVRYRYDVILDGETIVRRSRERLKTDRGAGPGPIPEAAELEEA